MPWILTSDLNADEKQCDAQHEATHAVVGVASGLTLIYVQGRETASSPPHCSWDQDLIQEIQDSTAPSDVEAKKKFANDWAVMCLASQFGEPLTCDVRSDEQQEAFHFDYVDAQWMRKCLGFPYFSRAYDIPRLEQEAQTLVRRYANAIAQVRLLLLQSVQLSQGEVEAALAAHPPSPS